jgi:predicted transcriptional regulator YdeE
MSHSFHSSRIHMEIVHMPSFVVHGVSTRTSNRDEMHTATARIGALWETFGQTVMPHASAQSQVFGVYHRYESDANGAYSVTAGIDVGTGKAPAGLDSVCVAAGEHMVFASSGAMPQAVIAAWQQVWVYFAQENCPHQRAYSTDFERHDGPEQISLFIALKAAP